MLSVDSFGPTMHRSKLTLVICVDYYQVVGTNTSMEKKIIRGKYLSTLTMLGKKSAETFYNIFLEFSRKQDLTCYADFLKRKGGNLHEMSNPVFWKNNRKKYYLRMVKAGSWLHIRIIKEHHMSILGFQTELIAWWIHQTECISNLVYIHFGVRFMCIVYIAFMSTVVLIVKISFILFARCVYAYCLHFTYI